MKKVFPGLTFHAKFIIIFLAIGVWRSLVSRLVRVQEASGSNPDTPTKKSPDRKCGQEIINLAGIQTVNYGHKAEEARTSSALYSGLLHGVHSPDFSFERMNQ